MSAGQPKAWLLRRQLVFSNRIGRWEMAGDPSSENTATISLRSFDERQVNPIVGHAGEGLSK